MFIYFLATQLQDELSTLLQHQVCWIRLISDGDRCYLFHNNYISEKGFFSFRFSRSLIIISFDEKTKKLNSYRNSSLILISLFFVKSLLNDFTSLLQWNRQIYSTNEQNRVENVLPLLREQITTTDGYVSNVSQVEHIEYSMLTFFSLFN